MTEALKKDWQRTCAERVGEQWEDRKKDLENPEWTDWLGFDYVEPIHSPTNWKVTGAGSSPGEAPATSSAHT